MSSAATAPPQLFRDSTYRFGVSGARPIPLASPDGGRLTLEQQLDGVWEGLAASGRAACPVCEAQMGRTGVCGSCGSRLS